MTMSSIPFILIVIKTLVGTATSACSNPIGKQTISCRKLEKQKQKCAATPYVNNR